MTMREVSIALENIDRRRHNDFCMAIASVNYGFNGHKVQPIKSRSERAATRSNVDDSPEKRARIDKAMNERLNEMQRRKRRG